MPRKNERYIEYNGKLSTEFGVKLMDAFILPIPAKRGTVKTAAGRDGDLLISDGSYDTMEIKRRIRFRLSQLTSVAAWLDSTGDGLLRFSEMDEYAYKTRFNQPGRTIQFKRVSPDSNPLMEGEITFICQPFRYQYPQAEEVTFTAAGTIHNPGTVYSQPRVTITGTGDFSVTIGGETIYFSDISGGIVIDSELMDALSPDGTYLMNNYISGTPWRLQPGEISVAGETDTGSSVTSVKILPRWRFL